MSHRVSDVTPAGGFMLRVVFMDGETRYLDVAPLFERWDAFQALRDTPGLFSQVRVDPGGYGISWDDHIDLECGDLWEYGTAPDQKDSSAVGARWDDVQAELFAPEEIAESNLRVALMGEKLT